MEFKTVFISELKPAEYNPRKDLQSGDPEYERIKASIEEFGYVEPVIVNTDYTVIGGHQRIKVLKELGKASIDVVVVDVPKEKEKALNIALNKITGEWDLPQLSIVLSELKEEGMDITLTGFTELELKEIDTGLFGEPAPVYGDVNEPPSEFKEFGEDIETDYHCPKCGYEWSGKPK